MDDNVIFPLICGLCPKRRVLTGLAPYRDGVIPAERRSRVRPSVQMTPEVPELWAAPGVVGHLRCKNRHSWALAQEELIAAYRRAVESGRREIVAGIDIA